MEEVISPAATFDARPDAAPRTVVTVRSAVRWYVWCLAAAVTFDAFGGYWDISWHISIGRDTFWTPAHMMVYLAGILNVSRPIEMCQEMSQ